MLKSFKSILSLFALGASVIFLIISNSFANPTKVGFVYLTTPGDHGWTYAHELGKQMVEKRFGNDVKILSLIHI